MPSSNEHQADQTRRLAAAPPGHSWAPSTDAADVLAEGWVLKKKRKKIQGYAKRYLYLTREGILTYSLEPGKPTRDFIEIPHASVLSSKRHNTIHVDSGSSVFHLQMLSVSDFDMWRQKLKAFIHERPNGKAIDDHQRQVYVVESGSQNLVSVDLTSVFALNACLAQSIAEARQESAKLASSDKLQKLLSSVAREQSDLSSLLSSKIPSSDGHASAPPSGFQALVDPPSISRAKSFTSTGTGEDDAVFYDADDIDLDHADEAATSHGATEDDGSGDESAEEEAEEESRQHTQEHEHSTSASAAALSGSSEEPVRTALPTKAPGDDVGLLGVLRKNVGKDLSTISFPVTFNLPLSLLQAAAEDYEYAPVLLERAAQTDDWPARISLIGAWAVSGYAATKLRASRKPFNPMLGETFELVRAGGRLKFVAEKVVHHPPIVAVFAEGPGWRTEGWSTVTQKFWGKSWELIPEGSLTVELTDRGERYAIKKPGAFMRNLIAGQKYIEYVGELSVTNVKTGQALNVDFKQGTVLGGASSRNHLTGHVYDGKGSKVIAVKGNWAESFAIQHDKENYQVLWEAAPFPSNSEDYYGFTHFALGLNELNSDLSSYLPRTDSRFRPDQRALEDGQIDQAEELKHTLETGQRQRRTELQKQGRSWQPTFFHADEEKDGTGSGQESAGAQKNWLFGGQNGLDYFKKRTEAIESGPQQAHAVWDEVVPNVFETK